MDWARRVLYDTPLERELLTSNNDNSRNKKYGKLVNIDGVEIYYVDSPPSNEAKIPELPTIVMIHGLGGCTLSFNSVSYMLNNFARVLLIDLPGHGNSPDPKHDSAFKPQETVRYVKTLLNQVCPGPFVLIGHSYGTSHAFRLSTDSELTKRCLGVVAITPPYDMPVSNTTKTVTAYMPNILFDVFVRANDRKGELYSPSVNRHFTPDAPVEARKQQLRVNLLARTRSVLQSVSYCEFYNLDTEPSLSCPVLIIGASEDEICSIQTVEKLHKDMKDKHHNPNDVQFFSFKAAGHGILFEKPELVNGIISNFLKERIDERLSMAWQLKYIANQDNKWSLKNEEKWKKTSPVGTAVGGMKGMKVLRQDDEEHGPLVLEEKHPEIAAIIDISREVPPYNPESFKRIKYYKSPTVSKIPPSKTEVKEWILLVKKVKSDIPDDSVIGVHCHYGFNRTGFFICSYLIEELNYSVEDALESYRKSRYPGIKHQHFIDELYLRYSLA